ncbi:hypothetical protein [Streptosporangium sp. OZ121]|uniref:hypothetical protein n=1 Tax=Streptosporangium sp. OZ121 TaxID=3444183 RepID=UPI003F7AB270
MNRHLGVVSEKVTAEIQTRTAGEKVIVFRFTNTNGPTFTSTSIEAMPLGKLSELIDDLVEIETNEMGG